jgi:hypothetical protein
VTPLVAGPAGVGFASPVNGTIENPLSGTMVNDDLGFAGGGDGAGIETLFAGGGGGGGAGVGMLCGCGLEAGARGVTTGLGISVVGGAACGVVTKVGVSTGGGTRGTPLVRLAYRVVVT